MWNHKNNKTETKRRKLKMTCNVFRKIKNKRRRKNEEIEEWGKWKNMKENERQWKNMNKNGKWKKIGKWRKMKKIKEIGK